MEEKKDRYLFGMHPVLEAVRSGKKFDKVLLKKGLEGDQFRELLSLLTEKGISFQFVPGERLNKAVRGAHQRGHGEQRPCHYRSTCFHNAGRSKRCA